MTYFYFYHLFHLIFQTLSSILLFFQVCRGCLLLLLSTYSSWKQINLREPSSHSVSWSSQGRAEGLGWSIQDQPYASTEDTGLEWQGSLFQENYITCLRLQTCLHFPLEMSTLHDIYYIFLKKLEGMNKIISRSHDNEDIVWLCVHVFISDLCIGNFAWSIIRITSFNPYGKPVWQVLLWCQFAELKTKAQIDYITYLRSWRLQAIREGLKPRQPIP
jgi:hypothetical protein